MAEGNNKSFPQDEHVAYINRPGSAYDRADPEYKRLPEVIVYSTRNYTKSAFPDPPIGSFDFWIGVGGGGGGGRGGIGPYGDESGRGGGGGFSNDRNDNSSPQKGDTCEQAKALAGNQAFKAKMNDLKSKVNLPREYGYLYTHNGVGGMDATAIVGKDNEGSIDFTIPGNKIDGFIHTHYTNLLSVFSPDDIYAMSYLYIKDKMIDPSTFTVGVVTANGTQYLLKIDDQVKFKEFASNLENNSTLELFSRLYIEIYKIDPTIAQELPKPNSNFINNSLKKFEGTWVWVNGIDTVKIILRKENIILPFPENSRADFIVGFHFYKKGNMVIESPINFVNTSYKDKHSTILGGNAINTNVLSCSLKDLSKGKLVELKLTLNSSQNQLEWKLSNREGVKVGKYDYGFTLPKSLTLTRQ